MTLHIAVDVGGTHIRAASYSSGNLSPIHHARISTQVPHATALERLEEIISKVWPQAGKVSNIAVAAPGPIDPYQGIIFSAPNIPGWVNLHLQQHLEERFNLPVALGNDANLAAMGEWKFGAGRGHHHLLYLTVSTGIGGGVIVSDRLLLGARGLAAELGHINVLLDGPLCGCGQRGHLEAVASGTAIARWVEQEIQYGAPSILPSDRHLSTKEIAAAARQGDQLAIAALARAGTFIGQALADFLHIFNPSIVIIGGGVSQSGSMLLEPMQKALQEHVLTPAYIEHLTLTTAALGDDVGLMGALALAIELEQTHSPLIPTV